jgi:hypothetical protein
VGHVARQDHLVQGRFRVYALADGRVTLKGPMLTGVALTLGPCAPLELDGVGIAVVSGRKLCMDCALLRMLSAQAEAMKIVVVKSANHFRADFAPIASRILVSKAAGPMTADLALTRRAADMLKQHGKALPADDWAAVCSLRVAQWVYLRDSTTCSIVLEPDKDNAYAVLGLTDRLSDVTGASGLLMQAGLVAYQGRYVCNGRVHSSPWQGTNLKKDFSKRLKALR